MGWFDFITEPVASLASSIIGAGSSAYSASEAAEGAEDANMRNIALAREQMAFQERMSNTAHQREVKDLKEAGLNPILSTRLGGASSPAGSMPNITNEKAQSSQLLESMGSKLASTPLAVAQLGNIQAQTSKIKADEDLSRAQRFATDTDTLVKNTALEYLPSEKRQGLDRGAAEIKKIAQGTRNLIIDERLKELAIPSAKAAASLGKIDDDWFSSKVGYYLRQAELAADAVSPWANSADAVSRMSNRWRD